MVGWRSKYRTACAFLFFLTHPTLNDVVFRRQLLPLLFTNHLYPILLVVLLVQEKQGCLKRFYLLFFSHSEVVITELSLKPYFKSSAPNQKHASLFVHHPILRRIPLSCDLERIFSNIKCYASMTRTGRLPKFQIK